MNNNALNNENGDKCLHNCFSKVIQGNSQALTSIDNKAVIEAAKQFA